MASSLAAILIATVPLFVTLIASRTDPDERPTAAQLAGVVVSFLGVVALVGIDIGGTRHELLGAAAILVAAIGYAAGALIVKRSFAAADPLGPTAAAMAVAAVMLVPFAATDLPRHAPSADVILALVVLGTLCSALAFLLFFRLVAQTGASRATVITYVNPIVALALGAVLVGERITSGAVAGLVLILAGSYLATRQP